MKGRISSLPGRPEEVRGLLGRGNSVCEGSEVSTNGSTFRGPGTTGDRQDPGEEVEAVAATQTISNAKLKSLSFILVVSFHHKVWPPLLSLPDPACALLAGSLHPPNQACLRPPPCTHSRIHALESAARRGVARVPVAGDGSRARKPSSVGDLCTLLASGSS